MTADALDVYFLFGDTCRIDGPHFNEFALKKFGVDFTDSERIPYIDFAIAMADL